MPETLLFDSPTVALASRTLLLAGYEIDNSRRQPAHIEILCHVTSALGARINYLLAITDLDEFGEQDIETLKDVARRDGRALVLVAAQSGAKQLGWIDFLDALGGAVPSWRALTAEYPANLMAAARNEAPAGFEGEVWRLFEDLVADGLEFCFGRNVRRLGARKRGQRVSDMISQIPDGGVLVIDAKASSAAFNATVSELRPLIEYTNVQRLRQRGHNEVFASVVVSSDFAQDARALNETSRMFLAETTVPVAFLPASTLVELVETLAAKPGIRTGVHWRRLLAGGPLTPGEFRAEVERVTTERYTGG
jgi:hypothetical protein